MNQFEEIEIQGEMAEDYQELYKFLAKAIKQQRLHMQTLLASKKPLNI